MNQQNINYWLTEQLVRGCTPESIVETMLASNYKVEIAQNAVYAAQIWVKSQSVEPVSTQTGMYINPEILSKEIPDFVGSGSYKTNTPSAHLLAPSRAVLQSRANTQIARPVFELGYPRIIVFQNFLSHEECDTLVAEAKSRIEQSTVVDPKTGLHVLHPERTSSGTHFDHGATPLVSEIEARIERFLGFTRAQQEPMQLLNYKVGGEYKAHFDYFDPAQTGSARHLQRGGQRIATLVMYLNDVESGGATDFPSINVSVSPVKGNVVYFENVDADCNVNPLTLHAGAPIIAGEKWIATKWIRAGAYI